MEIIAYFVVIQKSGNQIKGRCLTLDNPETLTNAQKTPIFIEDGKILHEDQNIVIILKPKRKVNICNPDFISLEDIKKYALLRFGSYYEIGIALGGLSDTYAHRLLNGHIKIVKDKTYFKIAQSLGISPDRLKEALKNDTRTN